MIFEQLTSGFIGGDRQMIANPQSRFLATRHSPNNVSAYRSEIHGVLCADNPTANYPDVLGRRQKRQSLFKFELWPGLDSRDDKSVDLCVGAADRTDEYGVVKLEPIPNPCKVYEPFLATRTIRVTPGTDFRIRFGNDTRMFGSFFGGLKSIPGYNLEHFTSTPGFPF